MTEQSALELLDQKIASMVAREIAAIEAADAAPAAPVAPAPAPVIESKQKSVATRPRDLECPSGIPRREWLAALKNFKYGVVPSTIKAGSDVPSDETQRRNEAYARGARGQAQEMRAEQFAEQQRPRISDVQWFKMYGKPRSHLCAGDAAMMAFKRSAR